jgi:hypothetical protein
MSPFKTLFLAHIELAFQKQIIGGRKKEVKKRAEILTEIWCSDAKGQIVVDSIFRVGFSIRKYMNEIIETIKMSENPTDREREIIRNLGNNLKPYMKKSEKITVDETLDILIKSLSENESIRDACAESTYLETPLKRRHRKYREMTKLIEELPESINPPTAGWKNTAQFLFDRFYDHSVEPELIIELLKLLDSEENHDKIVGLLVVLGMSN